MNHKIGSNITQSTSAEPPGSNLIMVAVVFLFFGVAILVIALISEVMIPLDFAFLFWITGFCFSIALISFIVAIVVRERGYGSEVEADEKTGTDEPVPSVEEASTKGVWTPQQLQKWTRKDFGRAGRFGALPTSDFKELVSELFRRMDYSVERSLYHADFGIDLIARKEKEVVSIEAKKWKQGRDVGTEIVRRAVEGRWKCGASKAIIITTSGFTPKAKVLAKKNPIELWDYKQLNGLIEKYFVE